MSLSSVISPRRSIRTLLSFSALAGLIGMTGASSAPVRKTVPGISLRMRAVLVNPAMRRLLFDGKFTKGIGRLDVVGSTGNGDEVQPEEYLLITDSTITKVNTLNQTVEELGPYDIGSLVAMVNAIDRGTIVINPKLKFEKLANDTMQGYSVRHYKFDVEYGLPNPAIPDGGAVTRAKGQYWVADLPYNFYNPFAGLAKPKGGVPGDALPAIATLWGALKELQVGTVMKFEATGVIGEGTARPTVYKRTVELFQFKNVDIDEATFKIPENYRRISAPARGGGPGRGRGRGTDTTISIR